MRQIIEKLKSKFTRTLKTNQTDLIKEPQELDQRLMKYISQNKCPFCLEQDLYSGPSGGVSTNILCGKCGAKFNDTTPITCDLLNGPQHYISDLQRKSTVFPKNWATKPPYNWKDPWLKHYSKEWGLTETYKLITYA